MSITWAAIREWDPAAVDDAAQRVRLRVDELLELADELNWKHPEGWHGETSDRARAERVRLVRKFDDLGHETDPLKRALRAAADGIEALRRDHDETEYLARYHDMLITDAGDLLTDSGNGPLPGSDEAADRYRIARHVRDEIARILAQATIIDEELAAALRRATYPAYYPDANGNHSRLNPPPDGTPNEINDWWLGLSEEERNELVATRPEWVGSTDGIPAEYRDTANRQVLADQHADLTARIDELEDDFAKYAGTSHGMGLRARIDALEAKLRGLNAIQNRLDNTKDGQLDAYLLGVDAGSGQAIIAMGNPDTATNVATFVPGTGSGLDHNIHEEMRRADSMARAGEKAGSPSTSVITWVGYAAPQDLPQAALASYAENAKHDLDQFQDGLRATHEGPRSHNTVIGHSYGSTVIGHTAATEGLDADEVVFVGSPGVGVDNVADLNMPAENVHATVAEHDMIHLSNVDSNLFPFDTDVHGPDPTGTNFGANVFESNPGAEGPGYMGGYSEKAHSQYWEENNEALKNMGRIIAGKQTI